MREREIEREKKKKNMIIFFINPITRNRHT